MRVKLAMLILAITSVTSVCRASDFSFTGALTNANQVQYFTFSVAAGQHVVIQSYGYAGGGNAAGTPIARGGFDPTISLYQGIGSSAPLFKANDDDFSCQSIGRDSVTSFCYDVFYEATAATPEANDVVAPLTPGTYVIALTNYGNFPNGVTLGDGFNGAGSAINCESYPRPVAAGSFADCHGNARDGHWALDIRGVNFAQLGIATPTVTVLSPNGGESFNAGTAQTISWSSVAMTGNVNVALLKAGVGYKSVATNVPVDQGAVTWTLPNNLPPGTDYSVRVMSAADSKVLDKSDANFTVAPSLTGITVLSPNGGESWAAGSTQTITWNATGLSGNVNVALLKAGVGNKAIATVPAAQGSYTCALPVNLPVAGDYTLRVISATDGTILDKSDAVFSIAPSLASLAVASPNGGETWTLGAAQTITWNAAGIAGNVNVALLKAGVGYKSIATNVPASTGSLTWTLPTNVPAGSDYSVRVMTVDGTLIDVSNAVFSVAQ